MISDLIYRFSWVIVCVPILAYLGHTYACVH